MALIMLGLILFLFAFPGKSIAWILGFGILAFSYQFFSFAILNNIRFRNIFKKESYREISPKRILASIFIGFALATASFGILFHLMYWPGAAVLRIDGIIFLIIAIIISTYKYSKHKDLFHRNVIVRSSIFVVVCTILSLIPTEKMVRFQYRNNPEYAEAFLKVLKNPDNAEYRKELEEIKYKDLHEE